MGGSEYRRCDGCRKLFVQSDLNVIISDWSPETHYCDACLEIANKNIEEEKERKHGILTRAFIRVIKWLL